MRKLLRELRESSNFTQKEFAEQIGIDRSTYTNIELGNKNPSFLVALRIKNILKYSGDDIFLKTNVPKGNKWSKCKEGERT